jgi:crotonobetainyl-CoA:carnitine CoA-transferase CaiB-like acyl-CoA transferase
MPGPVLHMASSPAPVYDGVPAIGEHTASVLTGALELPQAELAELAGRGIIGPV